MGTSRSALPRPPRVRRAGRSDLLRARQGGPGGGRAAHPRPPAGASPPGHGPGGFGQRQVVVGPRRHRPPAPPRPGPVAARRALPAGAPAGLEARLRPEQEVRGGRAGPDRGRDSRPARACRNRLARRDEAFRLRSRARGGAAAGGPGGLRGGAHHGGHPGGRVAPTAEGRDPRAAGSGLRRTPVPRPPARGGSPGPARFPAPARRGGQRGAGDRPVRGVARPRRRGPGTASSREPLPVPAARGARRRRQSPAGPGNDALRLPGGFPELRRLSWASASRSSPWGRCRERACAR